MIRAPLLLLALALPAQAQNAIERRIAEENPCEGARAEVLGGIEIGIDRLEAVEILSTEILIGPDAMTVYLDGRLACRSGPGSIVSGDASVRIGLVAEADLLACEATRAEVTLSEFGGSLGIAVELFSSELEESLERSVRRAVAGLCDDEDG